MLPRAPPTADTLALDRAPVALLPLAGSGLAVVAEDGSGAILAADGSRSAALPPDADGESLAFGQHVAAASRDGSVIVAARIGGGIVRAATKPVPRQRRQIADAGNPASVAMDGAGDRLAVGDEDGAISFHELTEGTCAGIPGAGRIVALDWSPSGDRVVAGSSDGGVTIVDASDLTVPAVLSRDRLGERGAERPLVTGPG